MMVAYLRRKKIRIAGMGLFLTLLIIVVAFPVNRKKNGGNPLTIPPLLEAKTTSNGRLLFDLIADESHRTFTNNQKTPTFGYNGDYLGPTIRVRRGDQVAIRVENRLDEATTVHWHGADVPAKADGGPHQTIQPGATWIPQFDIRQQAATLWYHPHLLGETARQVYGGLAGLFIIDDENSDTLNIPKNYGIDDIPLILQDRRFDRDGRFHYQPLMSDVMHGYFGNTLLVNGELEPTKTLPRGPVRLRILNGSNSTIMRITFDDQTPFHQIASDGGFLNAPVRLSSLVLSPGERAEIIVDFSAEKRTNVALNVETNGQSTYTALKFKLSASTQAPWEPPAVLNQLQQPPSGGDTVQTRRFVLETGMGGRMTINGKLMSMDRIDERVPFGAVEVWEIENRGGMMAQPHTFHVHAIQFYILDINRRLPPKSLSGRKDTVLLWPGDRVRVIAQFSSYPGQFMYHCHLLEHEDSGMMGQFLIEEDK